MDDTPCKPRPTGRPTLKTIAQRVGLAVPTVSRALNDAPDIGDATKQRVREAAREMGYRPNRAGQRLRTGKTNVIALALTTENDVMSHTARLIHSIAAELRGTPYHMIIAPYFQDEDPMQPIRYVAETGSADGLIMNQIQPEDPRVRYLMETGFPFVTHGRTIWSEGHAYYDFDNGVFARLAVEKLVARGRKSLMMIAPRADQNYSIEMVAGATEAARALNVRFRVVDTATSDAPFAEIEAKLVSDLDHAGADADGIISASATAAMAAMSALEAKGVTIGDTVDVLAKEAVPLLQRFRKEIIVVKEDVSMAGSFLARALMQAIDQPDLAPLQHLEIAHTSE